MKVAICLDCVAMSCSYLTRDLHALNINIFSYAYFKLIFSLSKLFYFLYKIVPVPLFSIGLAQHAPDIV